MNILVTGAGGQLGQCVQQVVGNTDDKYLFTDICNGYTPLNITNYDEICSFVAREQIECIINCAAYTDVDGAETAAEEAHTLNSVAPAHLAQAMRNVGGLLVHISTDYVFGSEQRDTPYKEEEACYPTSVYGQTKLLGEQAILNSGVHHIILRTAWLYSEYGHNFVRTMLALTSTQPQIHVVSDQQGTPTYARDLASAIVRIVGARLYKGHDGIYHYTNEGCTTWHAFAQEIARCAGNDSCEILPCTTADYPTAAMRPPYSVLDKTKFKKTFSMPIPSWQASLAVCLTRLLS